MALLTYLKAKISEYSIVLERIEAQIQSLDIYRLNHHSSLLQFLKDKLSQARNSYTELNLIVKLGDERLLPRGLERLHIIEYQTYYVSYHYLPALQNEGPSERAIRELLLSVSQRFSLVWIKDLIVKLDSQLATYSGLDIPIFFAPPKAKISFLEMPGLYHEIGHNFFRKFGKEIGASLKVEVIQYFSALRNETSPRRSEQDETYKRAIDYWNDMRLEEIFCDIFATWTCGIAHYVSCVDMGLLYECDPHEINFDDEHPPMSSRVYVCREALIDIQRKENLTEIARVSWSDHLKTYSENPDFRLICSQKLLRKLVKVSISKIEEYLPNAKRYDASLPSDTYVEDLNSTLSFEDILNRATKILLLFPEKYSEWEGKVIQLLGL